jgi:cellulose synthase/poly-beta-1,6-N-acetylglucosamine synthase-like glycosyltransferase
VTNAALWAFWLSAAATIYAYAGYPILLALLGRVMGRGVVSGDSGDDGLPPITMIVPAHNERRRIEPKLENTRLLDYPAGKLEVLFVSDGSTDGTDDLIRAGLDDRSRLHPLTGRGGKASALNAGLQLASHDVIVFSDASILLEPDALRHIARPFGDPVIGCVSGEDRIAGGGGEGLYGRYELYLRRLESRVSSIVGASGSFYAQRRHLCRPFQPGLAPDFHSVLHTVEQGYRAISQPDAVGMMTALDNPKDEFTRKVRTILRGITTLASHLHLLNPFRYGLFAVEVASHKLARWLVPFFLIAMLLASLVLAGTSPFYAVVAAAQGAFYLLAAGGLLVPALASALPVRVAVYFTAVNVATLVAWLKFGGGARQEIWAPTER